MSKITYTVICPNNNKHELLLVSDVESGSDDTQSSVDIYCPDCDQYVRAEIQGKLIPDTEVLREYKFRE